MPGNRGNFRQSHPEQPGGYPWSSLVHNGGTLAQRPLACAANNGMQYYATDQNNGTMYQSLNGVWVQISAPVTVPNSELANSTIGITAGTGLSGGGTATLGGSAVTVSH